MTRTTRKHIQYNSKKIPNDLKTLLIITIIINIAILVVIPHHFSFVSAAIIIPSAYLLILRGGRIPINTIRFVTVAGFVLSMLYAILVYYLISRGPYGCGGFFGEYSTCVDPSILQYRLLEVFATAVVLLYTALPLLIRGISSSKK